MVEKFRLHVTLAEKGYHQTYADLDQGRDPFVQVHPQCDDQLLI